MKTKFIFVTGGVYSSLGKGITASSIGCLLKEYGFKVTHQKLDPYLNVDSRNISPYQHGENFITDDGAIGDLDLGNYERFSRTNLTHYTTITSGKIYWEVLNNERNNQYNGKTIQVVPHITNAVADKFYGIADLTKADFVIVEIGGTVGDIESNPFIEAIARFTLSYGKENILFTHCCPLISIPTVHGELKTKPTQHSVKNLRSLGINPDILFLRSSVLVDDETKEKIAWSCAVPTENIFVCNDVRSIYFLPYVLNQQNVVQTIAKYFNFNDDLKQSHHWNHFLSQIQNATQETLKIAIVGQFVELHDAYLSLTESLALAGYEKKTKIEFKYIQANNLNDQNLAESLNDVNGIVIGNSETYQQLTGEKLVINYCLWKQIPIIGIDSGFDALIEFALDNKPNLFETCDWRIGGDDSIVLNNTLLFDIYHSNLIHQRHYTNHCLNAIYYDYFNNHHDFEIGAINQKQPQWVDAINFKKEKHPFAIFVNYRPEYSTKPGKIDALFSAFIQFLLDHKGN